MLNILKPKTTIILDTNMLFLPADGIDIFTEINRIMREPHEIKIVDKTLDELQKIIAKDGQKKSGFNAKLGYIMAKQKNLKTLSSSKDEYVDEAIVRIASKNAKKTIVATQDKELQNALKDNNVRIIIRRQNRLEMG